MMSFKYLHEPTHGTLILDHRLTPEVRAMLAAMVSRSPVAGLKAATVHAGLQVGRGQDRSR